MKYERSFNNGKPKHRNFDADSAKNGGMGTASANEATGLMFDPPHSRGEAEAAEELFPLEAPQTPRETEPIGDPIPGGRQKKPGTVRPAQDEKRFPPRAFTDEETADFGPPPVDLDRERVYGFFTRLGRLDPSFVPLPEDDK